MVRSAFTAPHVSVFVDVDATRTMEYSKRLKASPDFSTVKISPLLVMAQGRDLGGAPEPDGELDVDRRARSSSTTT